MGLPFTQHLSLRTKRGLLTAVFPRYSHLLDVLNHNARLNSWIHAHSDVPQFDERDDYFRYLNEVVCRGEPIDYLEFGVAAGDSIRQWARMNTHPDSSFVGFDTFEGLPEDWAFVLGGLARGTFDQQGKLPDMDDTRVSFRRGLFQDSLGGFLESFKPARRLVVHIDSDLYTAALYVLTKLDPLLEHRTG